VTGATGHVGNVLVRTLNARGITPRAFIRRSSDHGALTGAKYDTAYGDVSELDALTDAFRGCDTVIHCAAIITISERHNPNLRKTNVEGTRNVLTAAERAGVKRLAYVSSVHAITEPVGDVELNEEAGFDESLAHGAYGKSKAAASSLVQSFAREGRLDTVLVLPTGIIGPNDYRLSPQGKMIAMIGRGLMPLTLAGGYHRVDVRDVCEGVLAAHRKGRTGEAYLLDPAASKRSSSDKRSKTRAADSRSSQRSRCSGPSPSRSSLRCGSASPNETRSSLPTRCTRSLRAIV